MRKFIFLPIAAGILLLIMLAPQQAISQFGNATAIWSRSIASTAPSDGQVLTWSKSNKRWQPGAVSGQTGCVPAGSAGQILTDDGASACSANAPWTITSNTMAATAAGILDLHLAATTAFKVPGGFTTGLLHVTTSTGATAGGLLVNADITNGTIAAAKLIGTDIATVGTITSGTWTGTTIAIAAGGSGATTQTAAFDNLAPTATVPGSVIYWNGTHYVNLPGNNSGTNCLQEDASGVPSWASCGSGGGGANTALSNLASVSINTSFLAQTGVDLGSTTKPFRDLYIFGSGTYATTYLKVTGTPTGTRTVTIPDATGTLLNSGAAFTMGAFATDFSAATVTLPAAFMRTDADSTLTAGKKITFVPSATLPSLVISCGSVPSTITSGSIVCDTSGVFAIDDGINKNVLPFVAGSGATYPSNRTAGRVMFWTGSGFGISDDSDMAFSTDTLTVTKVVASTSLTVAGAAITNNVVQNSQSAAYTTVLGDAGKHILHPTADNNARTFTIDSNANVAYPIGTTITFVNQINTVTIAITSDTLVLAGAGTTGSRTLAANGIATAMKIASTTWIISGNGLT